MDGLKSFGRLLRRLRGRTPLESLAEETGLTADYLANVESGALLIEERLARHILQHGFQLPRQDTNRLILGLKLYDLGLKDNAIRQLVMACIRKELPLAVQAQLKQLAHRYTQA